MSETGIDQSVLASLPALITALWFCLLCPSFGVEKCSKTLPRTKGLHSNFSDQVHHHVHNVDHRLTICATRVLDGVTVRPSNRVPPEKRNDAWHFIYNTGGAYGNLFDAVTTVTTRSLRSLRGHYAVTTRSLRGHYAVTTRSLRGHYAVTTRSLRGHYGHYAVTTRSLRSLLGHYGHYAVTTRSLRSLWSLRGHYAVTMVTTRSLRGHYGHYAVTTVTTRSLRSLRGHCGHHAALKSYIVTHSRLRKRLTSLQNGLFDLDIVAVGL